MALVGLGDAGRHHARALKTIAAEQRLAWTAICARDPAKIATFRSELGVPDDVATFPTLDALLDARACDAVILATPDAIHAQQVERAARAGVHVLVEKPLASTLEEGALAVAAARESNVCLAVGYHLRHHAAHRAIVERLPSLVGELRSIWVKWAWPDLAMWIAGASAGGSEGSEAARVAAILEPPTGIDRAAEVSFRWGSALAHVSVSVVHRAVSRVLVSGDAGEVEAIGTLGARGDGELWHREPRKPPVAVAFEPSNPYAAQLRDFVSRAAAGFVDDPALLANLDILAASSRSAVSRESTHVSKSDPLAAGVARIESLSYRGKNYDVPIFETSDTTTGRWSTATSSSSACAPSVRRATPRCGSFPGRTPTAGRYPRARRRRSRASASHRCEGLLRNEWREEIAGLAQREVVDSMREIRMDSHHHLHPARLEVLRRRGRKRHGNHRVARAVHDEHRR